MNERIICLKNYYKDFFNNIDKIKFNILFSNQRVKRKFHEIGKLISLAIKFNASNTFLD